MLSLPQRIALSLPQRIHTVSGRADGAHSDARAALRSGRGLDAAHATHATTDRAALREQRQERATPDRFARRGLADVV